MKLDKEIIKYFKKWQQETGTCPEIDIDFVDFEFRKFGDFVRAEKGSTPKYSDTPTSCYVIKSGMARGGNNQFKLDKSFYLDLGKTPNPKYLKRGDLLLNTTGKGTAGRVTLFDLEGYYVSDSHITRFSLNPSEDSSLYFLYFLISYGFKNLEDMAEGTGGQVELNPEKIKNLEIIMPLNSERLFFQQKVIEFIQYYKKKFDAYRQLTSALRSKIESFDKAFLPAIFSSEKEPFIVEKFNKWAEGRGYGLKFDEIDFFDAFPFDDELSVKLIGAKKLGKHEELEAINDDNGLPVYDASHSILTYVAENRFPSLVFKALDESNPDISFASEGNSSAGTNLFIHQGKYFVNNHRTVLTFLDKKFYSKHVYYRLLNMKQEYGFQRGYIPSQSELKKLKIAISIPTGVDSFNIQQIIVEFIEHWQDWKAEVLKRIDELESKINLTEEVLIAKVFKGAEE